MLALPPLAWGEDQECQKLGSLLGDTTARPTRGQEWVVPAGNPNTETVKGMHTLCLKRPSGWAPPVNTASRHYSYNVYCLGHSFGTWYILSWVISNHCMYLFFFLPSYTTPSLWIQAFLLIQIPNQHSLWGTNLIVVFIMK